MIGGHRLAFKIARILSEARDKCKTVRQIHVASCTDFAQRVQRSCPSRIISCRCCLRSRSPARRRCFPAPTIPDHGKSRCPCSYREFPLPASRTPGIPRLQAQTFPEHWDEQKDRPHDKTRRARKARRNSESRKHSQFAIAVSGVAFGRARRRSQANEIHSDGVVAKP